ncbi:GNAT family N-acetyltransferase [Halorarum salinum]|uniref:GNAT family N-acetyltransferase n=1 Tax=Halorarum salinum TaxID=2743089 RepID=A0A7D5LC59_9EURY|nr:GNAT family N-acetyltransferase [Halobaculum salinum]QLG62947.1 GNAT family N-acetyltransferase [Halobaculum salinum]
MSYELRDGPPSVDDFVRLREVAGMAPRPREGVERGLGNSVYAVHAVETAGSGSNSAVDGTAGAGPDGTVGMARIVGDGGSVYHVCDMAVHPDHQGRGIGSEMMEAVMAFVDADAPSGAYVNLMADVDGFYERFGFAETRPASKGMYYRVE